MADATIWWVLAGLAVAVELLMGTFYLLMVAVGMTAGALAAHAGLSFSVQLLAAAFIGGGAVIAWSRVRARRPPELPASANRNVNLDIGETVQVDAWNADGTALVKYRGAVWGAVPWGSGPHSTGAHRVREVVGSRLVVEKI